MSLSELRLQVGEELEKAGAMKEDPTILWSWVPGLRVYGASRFRVWGLGFWVS